MYVDPGTHLTQQNQEVFRTQTDSFNSLSISATLNSTKIAPLPQADLNGRSAKKRQIQIKRTKRDYTCK